MDLRTGSSAVERRTRPRPLRGAILARPSPSCTHDDDRLRLPSETSPQKSEAGKKEFTDRRRNQACQPCVTPSSRSSLDRRRNAAHTVKGGSARRCGVNKSAKVVLVLMYRTLPHPRVTAPKSGVFLRHCRRTGDIYDEFRSSPTTGRKKFQKGRARAGRTT